MVKKKSPISTNKKPTKSLNEEVSRSEDPEELQKEIDDLTEKMPDIRNKALKAATHMKIRGLTKRRRAIIRRARKKREEETGIIEPRPDPKNIDTNLRAPDETIVAEDDPIIGEENEEDEFATYFQNLKEPKLMLTTCPRPSKRLLKFVKELTFIIPRLEYYERETKNVKDFVKYATKEGFTDVLVLIERKNIPAGLYISHLPEGPTSYFKLTSLTMAQQMKHAGTTTDHNPELVLNNFDTRLGHRIGRQIASLFPQSPEFYGRRVISFHNQRDFIFFRHYRYDFKQNEGDKKKSKAVLREIGPRFTLKLRWMHAGTFNTKEGRFEFMWRSDLQVKRNVQFI